MDYNNLNAFFVLKMSVELQLPTIEAHALNPKPWAGNINSVINIRHVQPKRNTNKRKCIVKPLKVEI